MTKVDSLPWYYSTIVHQVVVIWILKAFAKLFAQADNIQSIILLCATAMLNYYIILCVALQRCTILQS